MKSESNYLVSVIIPTFNRAELLQRSLMSVLRQTYGKLECIVVDDCSTDNTEQMVKTIKDDRIKYIKNPENIGASRTRNVGIKAAKGDFIAFNDSDDLWEEDKLRLQLELLTRNSDFTMVYCPYYFHAGMKTNQVPASYIPVENRQGNIFKNLLKGNMIGTPTILIRRECLEKMGGFNEQLHASEDYEFVLRVAEKFKIGYVDEFLVNAYHLDEGINFNEKNQINTFMYLLEKYSCLNKQELLPMILTVYNYVQKLENEDALKRDMERLWKFVCSIHAQKEFSLIQLDRNKKLLYENEILYKLVKAREKGELWVKEISRGRYKNIAIYGAGKIGIILAGSLKENKITVKKFIDSNNVQIEGYETLKKENIPSEIDFIIVSLHKSIVSNKEIQKFTNAEIVNIEDILL